MGRDAFRAFVHADGMSKLSRLPSASASPSAISVRVSALADIRGDLILQTLVSTPRVGLQSTFPVATGATVDTFQGLE